MAGYKENQVNGLDSDKSDALTIESNEVNKSNSAIKDDMLEQYGVWVKVEPETMEETESGKEEGELEDYTEETVEDKDDTDTEDKEEAGDLGDISFDNLDIPEEENIESQEFEEISTDDLENLDDLSVDDIDEEKESQVSEPEKGETPKDEEKISLENNLEDMDVDIDLEALDKEESAGITAEEFLEGENQDIPGEEIGLGEGEDLADLADESLDGLEKSLDDTELEFSDTEKQEELLDSTDESVDLSEEPLNEAGELLEATNEPDIIEDVDKTEKEDVEELEITDEIGEEDLDLDLDLEEGLEEDMEKASEPEESLDKGLEAEEKDSEEDNETDIDLEDEDLELDLEEGLEEDIEIEEGLEKSLETEEKSPEEDLDKSLDLEEEDLELDLEEDLEKSPELEEGLVGMEEDIEGAKETEKDLETEESSEEKAKEGLEGLDEVEIADFENTETAKETETSQLDKDLENINLEHIDEEIESIVEEDLLDLEEDEEPGTEESLEENLGEEFEEGLNEEDMGKPDKESGPGKEEIEVSLSEEPPGEDHFDDLKTYETELKDIKPKTGQFEHLDTTSILSKIEKELLSIKEDLSQLKHELLEIKKPRKSELGQEDIKITTPDTTGFFDEEEDETIALTGNELNNILNTADITEEVVEDSALTDKDEETINIGFDEEEPAEEPDKTKKKAGSKSWEESSVIDGIELEESPVEEPWDKSPDTSSEDSSLSKADDMIEYVDNAADTIEGTNEYDAEKELVIEENPDDVQKEKPGETGEIPGDDFSLDEAFELEIPEDKTADTGTSSLDGEGIENVIDFDDEDFDLESTDEEVSATELDLDKDEETGAPPLEEGEETLEVDSDIPEKEDKTEKSGLDSSDEIIEEIIPEEELELDLPDDDLDFEKEGKAAKEKETAGKTGIEDADSEGQEEGIEDVDLSDFDVDIDAKEKTGEAGTETIAPDAEGDIIVKEEISEDTLEDTKEAFDLEEETTGLDETTGGDVFQEETEASTTLKIPGDEETLETGKFSSDKYGTEGTMNLMPENLKSELKSVLAYMDKLLESLPDEKVEEFARSDYFKTYKKLFEELGLTT